MFRKEEFVSHMALRRNNSVTGGVPIKPTREEYVGDITESSPQSSLTAQGPLVPIINHQISTVLSFGR
jgi:hypothetical protein